MRKIAIIDHNEHSLYVEEINEEVLEKEYGGDIQKYVDDNYGIENYSCDWVKDSYYLPDNGDGDFMEVDFSTLV
jgi:hypothetical protein